MELTNEDVEEIVRLLDASYFNELHIKTKTFDLRLRRAQSGWTQEMRTLTAPQMAADIDNAKIPPPDEAGSGKPGADDLPGVVRVRAPMVGTFYRAPKPGAPPFVEIGSEVGEDTVVGIIETMKLMNPVSAGVAGTVVEICVSDGQLVEAQHTLMHLQQVQT